MKIVIFLMLQLSLYGEVVMSDGQCFERKGNMNYIVPCKSQPENPIVVPSSTEKVREAPQEIEPATNDNSCHFKLGKYAIEYTQTIEGDAGVVECDDSLSYIKSMFLGYEKTLSINKKKIGELIVKRGFSSCNIALYYGEYISIGVMSGDENMCNDFMVYHSSIKK